MPISTTSTFTCDRDGTVSEPVAAAENQVSVLTPPAGWLRMNWDGVPAEGDTAMASGKGYFCPTCVVAFREFLGPSGGAKLP